MPRRLAVSGMISEMRGAKLIQRLRNPALMQPPGRGRDWNTDERAGKPTVS
jgi:hypothetical protein